MQTNAKPRHELIHAVATTGRRDACGSSSRIQLTPAEWFTLSEHFGHGCDDEYDKYPSRAICETLEGVLNAHRINTIARSGEKATPARVAKKMRALGAAIRKFLDDQILAANSGLAYQHLRAAQTELETTATAFEAMRKVGDATSRRRVNSVWILGAIFRKHSPLAMKAGVRQGIALRPRVVPLEKKNATKDFKRACRKFVIAALDLAKIQHEDYGKNPSRIDNLIWFE